MKPYVTRDLSGKLVWINCEHITMMCPSDENETKVIFNNSHEIHVMEDFHDMSSNIFDMYLAPKEDEEESV